MAALPLIAFDVNETLLDLQTNLILYSAALTVADCHVPFTDIGAAVMTMKARVSREVTVPSQRRNARE